MSASPLIHRLLAPVIIVATVAIMASTVLGQRHPRSVLLDWGEFQSIGKVPPEFGDFVTLSLSTIRLPRRGRIAVGPLSGTLDAGGASEIKLVRPRIRGRDLIFTTRTKNGVWYRFSGTFPENYPLDEHGNPDGTLLQGVLIKLQKQSEVARVDLTFRFQFYSD